MNPKGDLGRHKGKIVSQIRSIRGKFALTRLLHGRANRAIIDVRESDIGGHRRLTERYDTKSGTSIYPFAPGGAGTASKSHSIVSFDRKELALILNVYGKKVAAGEWRDYALDMERDRAMFSIYQRTSERPLFVIEKNPRLARRQGQYMVMATDGRVLKRGVDLAVVLRVLDPQLYMVR